MTLGGASKNCPYSRSVVIPEVSLYVLQWDGTLLWAWKFCRYSRTVVISAVVIGEVDCMRQNQHSTSFSMFVHASLPTAAYIKHTSFKNGFGWRAKDKFIEKRNGQGATSYAIMSIVN